MIPRAELEPLLSELALAGPIEPFLVLADFLQGRGDPWGELISLSCHGATDLAKQRELEAARFSLLRRIADQLCPPDPMIGIAWQRGFIHLIAFSDVRTPDWLGDQLIRLLELPAAALCAEVSLAGTDLGDEHVQPLLRARPRLQRLARLDLSRNWFGPSTVSALRTAFPNARLGDQKTDNDDLVLPMGNSWAGRSGQ